MEFTSILNRIYELLSGPSFSAAGNILSIASFILTIIVFINVRKIRNAYVSAARVPDLVKKLKRHSSTISNQMNNFEGLIPQIKLELANLEVTLSSLQNKLNRQTKRSTTELLKTIKLYRSRSSSKDELWDIYIDINKLITEIEDFREDLKWERPT